MAESMGETSGTLVTHRPRIVRDDEIASVSDGRSSVEENQPKPVRNSFTLEIPALLLFCSWNLTTTVFQNQIIYQTCTISFDFNSTFCADMTDDAASDSDTINVEKYATRIFMSRAILENIIPAFTSFFIGPWSDKYGRRPVMLCTFFGYFLIYVVIALISLLSTVLPISPWYYLLAFIPISILGGPCALVTSIFCYITDVSTQADRAFRMARMEASVFIGLLIGSLSCSPLYNATSTTVVFSCAAITTFLGLTYVYFFVRESIQCPTSDVDIVTKFKQLFELKHVADMFRTAFKKRDGYDRIIIWLTMIAGGAAMFIMEGSATLSYIFMRERFGFTINEFNLYAATNIILQVFGNVIGIYILSKMLGVSEIWLAILGYGSAMTEYIIVGCAIHPWQLYAASGIALLKGVAVPMSRSITASVVPPSEIGKIYSMTTSIESLTPIGSAPLYTLIFTNTVETFPGLFNFVSATIYLGCIIMILLVYVLFKKRPPISYASIS